MATQHWLSDRWLGREAIRIAANLHVLKWRPDVGEPWVTWDLPRNCLLIRWDGYDFPVPLFEDRQMSFDEARDRLTSAILAHFLPYGY